jgi:ferredoxin
MAWSINRDKCVRCAGCVAVCPVMALEFREKQGIANDAEKCTLCRICSKFCPVGAIEVEKNVS